MGRFSNLSGRSGGSPFAGAPKTIPGAPRSVPGAPLALPGGPTKSGLVPDSTISSGYANFLTTVPDQTTSGRFRDKHTKQIRDFQGRYAGAWGVAWQGLDAMSEGMVDYVNRVEKARDAGMEALAKEMVAYMKANHPWENVTGDAERTLQAQVVSNGSRSTIWVGHGVPYGIWLEIMQNGRFAILMPTVLRFAPQVGGHIAAHV